MVKRNILLISLFIVISAFLYSANIIDTMKPGTWYEVPNSKMKSVFPIWDHKSVCGPSSVINAWSGGAYDTKRDKLIVWGGGHADYSGNEVYFFDVNSLSWSRLTEPSKDVGGVEASGYYPDGLPRSRHTYNTLQYVPEPTDRFIAMGGPFMYPAAMTSKHTDAFDFNTLKWEKKSESPSGGGFTAYDSVTGHLFFHGYGSSQFLSEYDPVNDKWIARGNIWSGMWSGFHTAAIDSYARKMVAVGMGSGLKDGEVLIWDISQTGNLTATTKLTTGDITITKANCPGFEYDSLNKKFIGWNGGADIFTLDTATFKWQKISPDSTNTVIPTAPCTTGTYGRFRYIPSKKAFIIVNSTDENVFIYKMAQLSSNTVTANKAPIVSAGADQTIVQLNTNLTGVINDDGLPAGKILTYQWTKISGTGNVAFTNSASKNTTVSFSAAGEYILRVSANDGELTSYDDIRVTVNPQVIAEVYPKITWQLKSGPGTVTFSSDNSSIAGALFSKPGTYVFTITATSGELVSANEITITVATKSTTTDTIQPTVPGNFTAFAVQKSVILSWSSSTDNVAISKYQIYRNNTLLSETNSLNYTDSNLTPSATYSYFIKAVDSSNNSSPPTRIIQISVPAEDLTTASVKITTITIKNLEPLKSKQNIPVTFGHIFKQGEISSSQNITLMDSKGVAIPNQVDKKATYDDGSLKHAIITAVIPSIQTENIYSIVKQTKQAIQTNTNISELTGKGYNFDVVINIGGIEYRASLMEASKNAATKWIDGDIATEWIMGTEFKTSTGEKHPHLYARYNVRYHKGTNYYKTDVIIENNWTYEPLPQNFTYDVKFLQNNISVYEKKGLKHYHHARWHKNIWYASDPMLDVQYDKKYLIATKAVPNYDQSLIIPEATLQSLATELIPAKFEPMQIGLYQPYMPSTGGRRDIGPLPDWTAKYILSMDSRAKKSTMMNGDAAASFPIHYRDKNTSNPLKITDFPYITILGNPGDTYNSKTGKYEKLPAYGADAAVPYSPDTAHQPSVAYVPYLISGDYYYLDELHFWATYNVLQSNPFYRSFEKGLLSDQVRGQAWSLRTLSHAAFITPDNHPMKQYFKDLVVNNINNYNAKYPNDISANKFGYIAPMTSGKYEVSPWMDDFFTWSVGNTYYLGFKDAKKIYDWKSKFPADRMTNSELPWIFAAMYHMQMGDISKGIFFNNYKEVYEASIKDLYPEQSNNIIMANGDLTKIASILGLKVNEMTGYSYSQEGYPSNMQPALAVAADSGIANGMQAWNKFMARPIRPDYTIEPVYAIVPYNVVR